MINANNKKLKYLSMCIITFGLIILMPSAAMAYDFKEGALSTLELIQLIFLIVALVVAGKSLMQREMMQALGAVVIVALILAIAGIDTIKAVGDSLLNLFTGGS